MAGLTRGRPGVEAQWLTMASPTSALLLLGWHMGALHPMEKVLTLVLAFGPFLVLAVVIWLRRRADEREDAGRVDAADTAAPDADASRPVRRGDGPTPS